MFFVGKKGRDRARERWEVEGGENGTQVQYSTVQ